MTYAFSPPRSHIGISPNMLVEVARCWRDALTSGQSVQPCLSRILHPHNAQILAPVLDSLLRFYELALGRALSTGSKSVHTRDETQLVGILNGTLQSRACMSCSTHLMEGLDRAVTSARIMMRLASAER